MDKFDGKYKIINASREGLKIGETDDDKQKEEKEKWQMLSEFLQRNLSGKINKAMPSSRLTTSPRFVNK
jgi:molecular chaperone HtpG